MVATAAELEARLRALAAPASPAAPPDAPADQPADPVALERRLRALAAQAASPIDAGDVGMSVASGIPRTITSLLGMPVEWLNSASGNIPQGAIPFFPTLGVPNVPPERTLSTQITGERRTVPPVQVPFGGIEDFRNIARGNIAQGALPFFPTVGTPNVPPREGQPAPPSVLGDHPLQGLIDYHPTTDAGRYAQTGTEWAVPSILGGPGGIVRGIGTGLLGGAAAQGTGDLVNRVVPEAYRPLAHLVLDTGAGLLTMGIANRPFMARSNPAAVVADRTRDVTPAQWQTAEGRMQAAPPGTLLPAEALGTAGGPLQGLTSDVMASRAGGPITQVLANRAPLVVQAGEREIANVGGPRVSEADVVRGTSEGARNVIGEAVAARTRATRPYYDAADVEQVPVAAFHPIIQDINARLARVGEDSEVGRALVDLRDRIIRPSTGTTVPIGPLSTLAQETASGLYPRPPGQTATVVPSTPMTARQQGVVGPIVQDLQATLEQLSPNYRAAQDLHRANSPRVNEVQQPDVMGNLQAPVTPTTNIPATFAEQVRMLTSEGVTPQQIDRIFGELSMSSQPQAARNLGAELLRQRLNAAADRFATTSSPTTGARFVNEIMGTPREAANLEAIVRGMARANGMNPDAAWTGFQRTIDTFAQHSRIPGIGSRTDPRRQLSGELGSNWVSNIMDLASTKAGSLPGRVSTFMGERAGAADYDALARVLSDTSPQGIQLLRQMAGQIPNSPRAQAMLTRALEAARVLGNTVAPQDQR